MRSTKPRRRGGRRQARVIWPNPGNRGTQMNISGGGMLKNAPNKEAAIKFLEYLASDEAQAYFADGNNEWPSGSASRSTTGARRHSVLQGDDDQCRAAGPQPADGAEGSPIAPQLQVARRHHAPPRRRIAREHHGSSAAHEAARGR
jgi:ABC-type Fe3+ transport system substrate-binding protein